jgi:ComF family protein
MDVGRPALRWLRRAVNTALDAVLPPQCLACGVVTQTAGALCAVCWAKIVWLAPPLCACCGTPFEFDPAPHEAERILCAPCLAERPAFERARAVFRYDEASRNLVLAFKHADRTHGAPAFGRWLARAGTELLTEVDIVAPVPLHWTRLAWRRYNQSALLAHEVARASGRPCIADLLRRVRRTPTQGERGRAARRRNVKRAFAVSQRHQAHLAGRRVVLIDDVFTTGATVEECARVLLEHGAASVDVLTLARVVRPVAT